MDMTARLIESAVERVCLELRAPLRSNEWALLDEHQLLSGLVACILGSQVPFELARAATEEIERHDLFISPIQNYGIERYEEELLRILQRPLHRPEWPSAGRRYRFPHMRAKYIALTVPLP